MDKNDNRFNASAQNSWQEKSKWFDEKHGNNKSSEKVPDSYIKYKTNLEENPRFVDERGKAIGTQKEPEKHIQKPSKKKTKAKLQPQKSKDELRKEYAQNAKRKRKGKILFSMVMVLLTAIAIVVILSFTVLFKIETVSVDGKTRYSAEKIIEVSGVKAGDNLWRISSEKLNLVLPKELPYINNVTIYRKIPDTIVIKVEEVEVTYSVKNNTGYYYLDDAFKILETKAEKTKGIILLGLEAISPLAGSIFESKVQGKMDIVKELMSESKKYGYKINKIDIENENDISAYLDIGVRLDFGSGTQISDKTKMANETIEKLKSENGLNKGVLNLKSVSKAFYKEGDIEKQSEKAQTKSKNKK